MKTLIVFSAMMLASLSLLKAQNVQVARIGHDKIAIRNNNRFSIALQIGDGASKTILYPGVNYQMDFRLTFNNVYYTPFITSYDYSCYVSDSSLCSNRSLREQQAEISNHTLKALLFSWLQGTDLGKGIDFIRGLLCQFIGVEDCNEVWAELIAVYNSQTTEEAKEARINYILDTLLKKHLAQIQDNEAQCIEASKQVLRSGSYPTSTFYLSQFIPLNEKWRLELTPTVSPIFNVSQLRGVANNKDFQKASFGKSPSYGARIAFNFNAYKRNGERKLLVNYYVPLGVYKTGAIYKNIITDTVFTKSKAFSWILYTAGFGGELTLRDVSRPNRKFTGGIKVLIDGGIMANTCLTSDIDSLTGKLTNTKVRSSASGWAPYLNFGVKIQLVRFMDLYGSITTTAFYNSTKEDLPKISFWNFGLSFNLFRKQSFQY